jgi:predicted 3-demethylubiquinone-9 3-methyltransferase (glyoxalase superfamily)
VEQDVTMQAISPFLWFDTQALEAAEFYVSIFPNSSIHSVTRLPDGGFTPHGHVLSVAFSLDGMEFRALNAGPQYTFTEAISFLVSATSQDEIDHYWGALTSNGGEEGACGWLKDPYGISWQVIPTRLGELLSDLDPGRSSRTVASMLGMGKIVIAELEAAADAV